MRAGLKHKKAKRMTAEGAYRKATTSLTSDMMQFSAEEDIKYAKELLPTSSSPSAALAPRPAADTAGAPTAPHGDAIPDPAENSPLKGVRYAALTAPGPSGTRPEHIRDMLSVPRRRDANRLLQALAQIHKAMVERRLSDAARWLTRTRLCWQRKKNNKPRTIKWASSCARATPSAWLTLTGSDSAPRSWACTNGATQCPLRPSRTGASS